MRFYDRREIRDLVAYLSVIQSPHDSISLTRVLLAPCWRFPEDLALPIRKQAAKARCSVYSAIQATEMTLFKDDVQLTGWPELKKLLRDLKQLSEHAPITAVFDELAKRLRLSFLPGDPDRPARGGLYAG